MTEDLTLEVERLRAELERARYKGGGSYPRAIGEIEAILGITAAVPLEQTVQAVRNLSARLSEATALLERVQRKGPTRGDGALNGDIKAFLTRADPERIGK